MPFFGYCVLRSTLYQPYSHTLYHIRNAIEDTFSLHSSVFRVFGGMPLEETFQEGQNIDCL